MGNSLRMLHAHLGLTLALQASGAAADAPASNLETGDLHRYWVGTGPVEHTLAYVAPGGQTVGLDTVVLAAAAELVAVTASVALQRTDDGVAWTDVWTLTPILTSHLAPPEARHYVRETALDTRRGWRIRIYGALTGPPKLSGGFFLGVRTELPTSPQYGRGLGVARAHAGRELDAAWPPLTRVQARALKAALAAVTPDWAEGTYETVAGVVYGGRPHWLYDPLGRTLSESDPPGPALLPVVCLTPGAALSASRTPTLEAGPTGVRWRERR
jgi:hypothetical protein